MASKPRIPNEQQSSHERCEKSDARLDDPNSETSDNIDQAGERRIRQNNVQLVRASMRTLTAVLLLLCLASPTAAQVTIAQPVAGQTNVWPVSKVIGVTVYNGQSQAIRKISDLLMDPQARVATAILSVGDYLGVGERLVQVPLAMIRFPKYPAAPSVYPEKAVLNTSQEALAGMPEFKY